jgi:hypothetical protein
MVVIRLRMYYSKIWHLRKTVQQKVLSDLSLPFYSTAGHKTWEEFSDLSLM